MPAEHGYGEDGEYRSLPGMDSGIRPVPQQRIMEKVDECMGRLDYAGAERVLLYWLAEARAGGDLRGQLMIRSELVGHYRKTGEREKARESADDALALIRALGFEGTLSAAAAYVNMATADHSFGLYEEAYRLFADARAIMERSPGASPELLGGLYNNMGLTCAALGRYDEAFRLYDLAMERMEEVPGGAAEQAVTCLNRADALAARDGMEAAEAAVFALLDQAEALLDSPSLSRNGYYAYVCGRCAPVFDHYGYFAAARTLRERAEAIYEGS